MRHRLTRWASDWLLHDLSPGWIIGAVLGLVVVALTAVSFLSGDLAASCNLGQSC